VKVILRSDVKDLGKLGDIVDVSDGYARNYLVPKGLAMRATDGALEQAQAMRRSRDQRDSRERAEGEDIARRLVGQVIEVPAKVGSAGHLYGSVTTTNVAEAVEASTGLVLDRRRLHINEPIRTLGTHEVTARLHAEVQFNITVEVVPEES